ncbi:RNA polymerase sigma factor [Pedobacter sp. L105]|uniref:RNA polymerase sigma factor n=1 Tax=Pedobacter sp. L105 TaxID=1641871 RepID=UPI00131BE7A5|nr:sigma-70 family RNA polymerase sigma factor [Pedobacter sp. L105]
MISKLANYTSFTDAELIAYLRESDRGAFDEIYERYWKKLYNETFKRMRRIEVVDEIVQDVFSDLWTKRGSRKIDSLYPYLITALRYQVFMVYRRGQAGPEFIEPLEHIALADLQADSLLNEKELKGCIAIWMSLQPEKRRVIFQMKYMEERSTKEISEILGISQKTVQNQLLTSFASLREFLSKLMILISL